MAELFLTCIHDRHTDDKFKAFVTEQAAKDYLRSMSWPDAQENINYGDWCLFLTDDYYMFVQKIEVSE